MKPHNLIVIPFHNPLHWHTDYANQTANWFAKENTVIRFLWGDAASIKEICIDKKPFFGLRKDGNIISFQPIHILPLQRFRNIRSANFYISLLLLSLLIFITATVTRPKRTYFFIFGFFEPLFILLPYWFFWTRLVYDCVDVAWHPSKKIQQKILQSELFLIHHAHMVFANSHVLHKKLSRARKDIHLVPLGFRIESFSNTQKRNIPSKPSRIVYIGSIDYRMDYSILHTLAHTYTYLSFLLIGPFFPDLMTKTQYSMLNRIKKLPNVSFQHVSHKEIPHILNRCNIGIIPFVQTIPFARYAFPMKTMEYLYAGLPIISSDIEELRLYSPHVRIAKTNNAWVNALHEFLNKKYQTKALQQERRHIALQHTWNAKLSCINNLLKE